MADTTLALARHARAMRDQGWWQDLTFDDLLERAIAADPGKTALVAYRTDAGSDTPVRTMTHAELGAAAAQVAGAFRAMGIGKGDVVAIMVHEGASHVAAATSFLADICRVVEAGADKPRLTTFLCGGAQVPPVVIEYARALLGLNVTSLWGMTESLAGSLTEPDRAADKSATTDGRAVEGVDLLSADEALPPLPHGTTGRLYFRGAQQFLGYYRKPGLDGTRRQRGRIPRHRPVALRHRTGDLRRWRRGDEPDPRPQTQGPRP